ncbi:hypothetical protein KL86DYS2_12635 [uncultured Dysgonomonas sp.]|uniref:Uncharacterized protein n=1 Tax=uncultured Dysgonomonas sp. TaxID=206096 RepID=A0A212JYR0_9BACT|nr:hypothetical protein KL86DYS2_12635 [uncultured Dysgonomonas sp.]
MCNRMPVSIAIGIMYDLILFSMIWLIEDVKLANIFPLKP